MDKILGPSLTLRFMFEQGGRPKILLPVAAGGGYASTSLLTNLIPNFRVLF
jgi:hypothetical protein